MKIGANVQCGKTHRTCQLSRVQCLFVWVLLWRLRGVKQMCKQRSKTHLHATFRRENTVITKTPLMLLIHAMCQRPYRCFLSPPAVYSSVFRVKKPVMQAATFEIIHFFCPAEQNIWPRFLAYRQIINNSQLIFTNSSFLSLLFSSFHYPILVLSFSLI